MAVGCLAPGFSTLLANLFVMRSYKKVYMAYDWLGIHGLRLAGYTWLTIGWVYMAYDWLGIHGLRLAGYTWLTIGWVYMAYDWLGIHGLRLAEYTWLTIGCGLVVQTTLTLSR